jgi:hypothetical protein
MKQNAGKLHGDALQWKHWFPEAAAVGFTPLS